MGTQISRMAHPADGSRAVETIQPEDVDSDYYYQHRCVGTNDDDGAGGAASESSNLFVVLPWRAIGLIACCELYMMIFTLQMWSYASYTRYYYGSTGKDTTGFVYFMFLCAGILAILVFGVVFIVRNIYALANHNKRIAEGKVSPLKPSAAPAAATADAATEQPQPAPPEEQTKKEKGSEEIGLECLMQVIHPASTVWAIEERPKLEKQRTQHLIYRVIVGCWVPQFAVALMDFIVFVDVTDPSSDSYKRVGRIGALYGITIALGIAAAIFPPWYVYQHYAMRFIARYYQ